MTVRKRETPILTREDIPYEASVVFNAGVARFSGKYMMVFRNDKIGPAAPREKRLGGAPRRTAP